MVSGGGGLVGLGFGGAHGGGGGGGADELSHGEEGDGRDAQFEGGAPGQGAEAAVQLHVLLLNKPTQHRIQIQEPCQISIRAKQSSSRGEEGPDLDFVEFGGEGAGEGRGAEQDDDAADRGPAGQPPGPLLHHHRPEPDPAET